MAHRAGRNNAAVAGGDDAASVSAFFALVSYNIVCGAGRKAPPVLLPCGGREFIHVFAETVRYIQRKRNYLCISVRICADIFEG